MLPSAVLAAVGFDDSINPSSVTASFFVGDTLTIRKAVTIGAVDALVGLVPGSYPYSEVSLGITGAIPDPTTELDVDFLPSAFSGSFDRSVERTFNFDVTIKALTAGVYNFFIEAYIFDTSQNQSLVVAIETDTITVPSRVPEPATLALFGLGLAGLGAVRRKKLAA